jgi:uncharacterized membrane protein YgcG
MAKRATARKPIAKARSPKAKSKPKVAAKLKRGAPAKLPSRRKTAPKAAAAFPSPFRSKRDWTSFLFWLNDISRAAGVTVPEQFRPALAMNDGGGEGGGEGGDGGGEGGGGGGEGGDGGGT